MKRLWFALAIALSAHMVLLYFLPSLLVKRPDPAKPETKSAIRSVMITMSYRAPEILKKAAPEKEPAVQPIEKKTVKQDKEPPKHAKENIAAATGT